MHRVVILLQNTYYYVLFLRVPLSEGLNKYIWLIDWLIDGGGDPPFVYEGAGGRTGSDAAPCRPVRRIDRGREVIFAVLFALVISLVPT